MVRKDGQDRRAEILSIKVTRSGRQFYCNFDSFNKRLDEWVPAARIRFDIDVEWPSRDQACAQDKNPRSNVPSDTSSDSKTLTQTGMSIFQPFISMHIGKEKGSTLILRMKLGLLSDKVKPDTHNASQGLGPASHSPLDAIYASTHGASGDSIHVSDFEHLTPDLKPVSHFSRDAELEKLRTSGSMTQNPAEISRIRNISKVQFGEHDLFPWYFSPYPESFTSEDVMFICEFCLSFYGDDMSFRRHRRKCVLHHPPGNEIYRDDSGISFFEIDGRRQRTWCRNLCLLSKMFLDHKTLYYDVDPFLFYVMTTKSGNGYHLVGYFSKEKESADGYNVACILTLPQYQRKGYGRLLIQFSYELSRIEGRLGSPEKPLSDLGLLSYRQYWSENIIDLLINWHDKDEKVTIEMISNSLSMTTQDVEHTLQALKMQVYHRGDHKIVIPESLISQRERQRLKPRRSIDAEKIQWKPPSFPASTRTWGW
jgi:histone acetyltransferase HTATIP